MEKLTEHGHGRRNALQTIATLTNKVLTEIKEPTTKALPLVTLYQSFKKTARFETFSEPDLTKALESAATFVASLNVIDKPYWLTLTGASGNGKTHLAKAIWKQFMRENRFMVRLDVRNQRIYGGTGVYVNWRRLCADVREGAWGQVDDICREHFAVIDDLGAEYDKSGFIASVTDRILNERMGKWTVITTNIPLSEVAARIDTRAASRMIRDGNVVVDTKATDFALRQK